MVEKKTVVKLGRWLKIEKVADRRSGVGYYSMTRGKRTGKFYEDKKTLRPKDRRFQYSTRRLGKLWELK